MKTRILMSMIAVLMLFAFAAGKVPSALKGKRFDGEIVFSHNNEEKKYGFKIECRGGAFDFLPGRKSTHYRIIIDNKKYYGGLTIQESQKNIDDKLTNLYLFTCYTVKEKYNKKAFKKLEDKDRWFYFYIAKDSLKVKKHKYELKAGEPNNSINEIFVYDENKDTLDESELVSLSFTKK